MYGLMDVLYGVQTRAGSRRAATVETVMSSQLAGHTRTEGDSGSPDERVYLVNFGNDEGFAVLGANVYMPSVICIAEKGSFTLEEYLRLANEPQTRSGSDPDGDAPEWMSYEDIHNYGYGEEGNPDPFVYEDYCIDWDEGDTPEEDTGDYLIYAQNDSFIKGRVARLTQPYDEIPDGFGGDPNPTVTYVEGPWTLQAAGKIEPLLTTQWDQGSPFNKFCPVDPRNDRLTSYAGCVAIALAQIIAFNEKPAPSTFNYYGAVTSTWEELKNHNYLVTASTPDAIRIRDDMAKIIRAIGNGVNMGYSYYDGSNSSIGKAKKYLKGISDYYDIDKKATDKEDHIKGMLNNRLPVYIKGRSNNGGHAWVIDGSATQNKETKKYVNGVYHSSSTVSRALYHCNFGWFGHCDGYYRYDVFNTIDGPETIEPGVDPYSAYPGSNHYNSRIKILKYKVR